MNCGLITLYGNINYGNKLQNFAIEKIFEGYGIKCNTIVPISVNNMRTYINDFKYECIYNFLPSLLKKKNKYAFRKMRIKKFSKKNLSVKYLITKSGVIENSISNKYDFFITGSDQVWNPTFNEFKVLGSNYLLDFTDDNKKLSLSPSFGISKIPENWVDFFTTRLKKFTYLSCREKNGCDIIEKLSGHKAVELIDPTLMFDKDEWGRYFGNQTNKKNYIFCYMLGNKGDKILKDIETLKCKFNLSFVDAFDINSEAYYSNPFEFIQYICNASIIITDSFHACVFSFLFNRPFIVYEREDKEIKMSQRINDLLEKFKINRQTVENINLDVKYDEGYNILNKERTKMRDYIESFLNKKQVEGVQENVQ